jgi:hypothetical protein
LQKSGRKIFILLIIGILCAVVLAICGAFILRSSVTLPVPKGDVAVNAWDYWINRYQTLISGVLAILAGLSAIIAARMTIKHDRLASTKEEEDRRRASANKLARAVEFTVRSAFSKHHMTSLSRHFPQDIYPGVLLDTKPLQEVTLGMMDSLPASLAMRCLFLDYAFNLLNELVQNAMMAKDVSPVRTFKQNFADKMPYLLQAEGLLACGDIVQHQLEMVAERPLSPLVRESLDYIDFESLQRIMMNREVPIMKAAHFLRDLNLAVGMSKADLAAHGGLAKAAGLRVVPVNYVSEK